MHAKTKAELRSGLWWKVPVLALFLLQFAAKIAGAFAVSWWYFATGALLLVLTALCTYFLNALYEFGDLLQELSSASDVEGEP